MEDGRERGTLGCGRPSSPLETGFEGGYLPHGLGTCPCVTQRPSSVTADDDILQ